MRLEFVACESVPRLSWCARLRRGGDVVRVYHGPWVETHGRWFVEGAWTGAFEKGEIDSAQFNAGTGGVLRGNRVVFSSPSDIRGTLYAITVAGDLYISNSIVFVLAMAREELDPVYPYYAKDIQRLFRLGVETGDRSVQTRSGNRLRFLICGYFDIDAALTITRREKPTFPVPGDYREYVACVRDVMSKVLANADSPHRVHRRYPALAMVSSGYDAPAVSALLASLGVRDAISFYDPNPGDDAGREVSAALGITAREYGRRQFLAMPGVQDEEFLAFPQGADIVLAPCEEQLVGRLLVTGRNGDLVLSLNPAKIHDNMRHPDFKLSGVDMIEFRFRVGFLDFNPLYVMAMHSRKLFEISHSDDMKPWRVGGAYDRPIARRIAEEAGVPRAAFGFRKAATANFPIKSLGDMSPRARASFEEYLNRWAMPLRLRRAGYRALVKSRSAFESVAHVMRSGSSKVEHLAESLIPVPAKYQGFTVMDLTTHWAQEHVRKRYAQAMDAAKSP